MYKKKSLSILLSVMMILLILAPSSSAFGLEGDDALSSCEMAANQPTPTTEEPDSVFVPFAVGDIQVNHSLTIDETVAKAKTLTHSGFDSTKETQMEVQPLLTAPYAAGSVKQSDLNDALAALKMVRFLAGVPYENVYMNSHATLTAQHKAVLMAIAGTGSSKPADMSAEFYNTANDYTGENVYGSTNLRARNISYSTLVFIADPNFGIYRTMLLLPNAQRFGIGFAKNLSNRYYTVVHLDYDNVDDIKADSYVAWPNGGDFPIQYFANSTNINDSPPYPWTISLGSPYNYPRKNNITLKLTRTRDNKEWYLDKDTPSGISDNLAHLSVSDRDILFRPDVTTLGPIRDGDVFKVELSGIQYANNTPATINYEIRFFDLAKEMTRSRIIFAATHNGNPVQGATVTIDGQTLTTDAAGKATLRVENNRTYSYAFSKDGYYPETGTISVGSSEVTKTIAATKPVTPVTFTLTNNTVTYNGTAQGITVTPSPSAPFTVKYNGSTAVPKDAGTYAVQVTADAPDYSGTQSGTFTINKANATVKADDKSKKIGNPDPALTYSLTSGTVFPGDAFSGALARASGETTGSYAINRGTLTLGNNYNMTFVAGTFSIQPKTQQNITVSGITDKTYGDASFALTVTPDAASKLRNFTYESSNANVAQISASGIVTIKGAGQATITVREPGDSEYAACAFSKMLNVGKRNIAVAELGVFDKQHDGSNAGTINTSTLKLTGLVEGDDVTIDLTKAHATFASANVADNVQVTISNLVLIGADAANYNLTTASFATAASIKSNLTASVIASEITAVPLLSIDATEIAYPTVPQGYSIAIAYSSSDVISADGKVKPVADDIIVNLRFTVTNMDKPSDTAQTATLQVTVHASTRITVTLTASTGGTAAGGGEHLKNSTVRITATPNSNYTFDGWYKGSSLLSHATAYEFKATENVDIAAKFNRNPPIPVTFTPTNNTVVYNGTAQGITVSASPSVPFTVKYNGSSAVPKDAGTYAVQVAADADGYSGTQSGTFTINKANVTVKADDKSKKIGNPDPALTHSLTSGTIFAGDAFSGALARVPGEAIGSYAISQGNLTLGNNYNMTFVPGTFTILPKTQQNITVSGISDKTYGDPSFALTVTPDAASRLANFTYESSNSNVAQISASGIVTIKGAGQATITVREPGDSEYAACTSTKTLNVGKRNIAVAELGVFDKQYDGTRAGTINTSALKLSGLVEGDDVTIDIAKAHATFASANIADDVQVTIGNLELTGADAANYNLTTASFTTAASIKTNLTASVVASEITAVPLLSIDATAIVYPTVPQGYSIAIAYSSSNVIGDDGKVKPVAGDIVVNLRFIVTNTEKPSDTAQTATLQVTVHASTRITVTLTASIGGTVSGGGEHLKNSTVRITATPNSNYTFDGWYKGSSLLSPATAYEFKATENVDIAAKFTRNPPIPVTFTLTNNTVTYNGTAQGITVAASPSVPFTVKYNGSAAVPKDAGTYAVQVAADTDDYSGTQSGTFTINKANATVKADDKSKKIGNDDPALTYSLTSGAVFPGDAFTGALARVPGEAIGSYAINRDTLTLGNNYNMTFVPGTFTILPKTQQNITVSGITDKTYGDASFALTVTPDAASRLANFTCESSNSNVAQISATGIVTIKGAGQATITVRQPGDSEYATFTFSKTLDVGKKALTITANDATATYGDAIPHFVVTYSGFISGENESALDKKPIIAAFPAKLMAGDYDIVLSGAESSNYRITYVKGTLRVSKRDIAVAELKVFDKQNDGTNAGTINTSTLKLAGLVEGDDVTINFAKASATFASASIADDVPVTISNLELIGADAANYKLTTASLATAASIKSSMTAGGIAEEIAAVPLLSIDATEIVYPIVPPGYTIVIASSSSDVIGTDGKVKPVAEDTVVELEFIVTNAENPNDAAQTATLQVTVYASTRITVTLTASVGGTAAGGGEHLKNTTVTVTATPDSDYKFDGWYKGSALLSSGSAYEFKATENVAMTAKFTKNSTGGGGSGGGGGGSGGGGGGGGTGGGGTGGGGGGGGDGGTGSGGGGGGGTGGTGGTYIPPSRPSFTDVASGQWYYAAVNYVVEKGLFVGTSETTFSPNNTMTRAMLVTVLWRLHGSPAASGSTFTDVASGQWYYAAVAWAATNNIVTGVGGNLFAPDRKVTREQMAAILYRYEQFSGKIPRDTVANKVFADSGSISEYAKIPVAALVTQGIITGKHGNLFDPQGSATRAEVATVIHRFMEAAR